MPRQSVVAERESQILEAAIAVFSRMGFDQARMDDIAHQAGLSKGTLYWYFKSKDDLIAAILRNMFAGQPESLRRIRESAGSAGDRLLALGEWIAGQFEQMSSLLPVAYEFYAVAARNEPVRSFLSHYFRVYREEVSALVREGIERAEFRPEIIPDDVAVMTGAMYEGLALLWMIDPSVTDWSRAGSVATAIILDGLRTSAES